jgi:RHS repeat-associated protein
MMDANNTPGTPQEAADDKFRIHAPQLSLPRGGGAIRGIGEKFTANPVTGTGSMFVPIATSPGRSGFGPQLSISYDSGAGNGAFGLGWHLSLPAITRKTDKGLPRYDDADESDVFILSGAEDLVPLLVKNSQGGWVRDASGGPRVVGGSTYQVLRYRPRVEGLFARIERWVNASDSKDVFWRSISKDNITRWYGKTAESRIAGPRDPMHIFSWLICESYDDKGNVVVYRYKPEDSQNVDASQLSERNRSDLDRSANRYLKRVRYGNRAPYYPVLAADQPWPLPPGTLDPEASPNWTFEVVLDYGEHDATAPLPSGESQPWACRHDPTSSYRSTFEVRTYRRCARILMFHHFPDEAGVGADCLVRSTNLSYSDAPVDPLDPIYSFVLAVQQLGYRRNGSGYLSKGLPPLEFEYTRAVIDETLRDVDPGSLENLPSGMGGGRYQWVDLEGEGSSGILSEQGGAWYYKTNLSAANQQLENGGPQTLARFGPNTLIRTKPSLAALGGGRQQLVSLSGNGLLDLVDYEGPTPGYFERTEERDWKAFATFPSLPALDWRNPNLRFVDLTGDGFPDLLISESDAFWWHESLAKAGFGPAQRTQQSLDEEKGPQLIFADGTESIFLADMSGDGLTDLVRIRNGEACYWPNLGFGRFGAKVGMDGAPSFEAPDLFDGRRIRLADIDGSGAADIIYFGSRGTSVYFNLSGNSWSHARLLGSLPPVDKISTATALDLLGNGTACLVWSSSLPGNARRQMRYVKLMGENKPHLLVKFVNNLGSETHIDYAPSTKFYVADKLADKPWITRLPFPVHCVERVSICDEWRDATFTSSYSYHHGYYDGIEREFRGFGRVEQVDVEDYDRFIRGNSGSPYITGDKTLYQPPVKTITWYHTGVFLDERRVLSHYEGEYFPDSFESQHPKENVLGGFTENALPEPDLAELDLTADEWRESLRACKGMVLRQEVYELDVDALTKGEHKLVKLFSTAYHNCHIDRLQPRGTNLHAVFLVTESETITYHYELDLRPDTVSPDPRVVHTLNLNVDQYGHVLQSVAVAYPRLGRDTTLPPAAEDLIAKVQTELHLAYTESAFTGDINDADDYRVRLRWEVKAYELTGISPPGGGAGYFSLEYLRGFRLGATYQSTGTAVADIPYQQLPDGRIPQKRLVEDTRTIYFADDLTSLPLQRLGRLGLKYEDYKLALTDDLLTAMFGVKLSEVIAGATAQGHLANATASGYLSGAALAARFAPLDTTGQYWIRSGIAGFQANASLQFYLPNQYTDPFGNVTTLNFDPKYYLFLQSSIDMHGNTTSVDQFDFRVLAPSRMKDVNGNLSEMAFDALGMPAAMALLGTGTEGDSLGGFTDALLNPISADLEAFFTSSYSETVPRQWLNDSTMRYVYWFGEVVNPDNSVTWAKCPAAACGILREQHVAVINAIGGGPSPLQVSVEYSDGLGAVLVKKSQAEPVSGGVGLRWIASGKTIPNNKGKPVKQYEPYFSQTEHRFDATESQRGAGVTPVLYYDAPGRLIRTESPDGSYSRVEFTPWDVETWDQNDTLLEPGNAWYAANTAATATPEQRRAAQLASLDADTPSVTFLDSLGRNVVAVAHNKFIDSANTAHDEKYLTFTKLDAEGKPLWIRDARGNLLMQYIAPPVANNAVEPIVGFTPCYDIAHNLLFQHSMDAGDRWMLMDAAGKPMLAWDFNELQTDAGPVNEDRLYFTSYDNLHRPTARWLAINGNPEQMAERFEYRDAQDHDPAALLNRLQGQLVRHYDPGGLAETIRRDFKGNVEEAHRTLNNQPRASLLDWQNNPSAQLANETFAQITEHDALNRVTRLFNWHKGVGSRVAVYESAYNQRGALASENLTVRATKTAASFTAAADTVQTNAIQEIRYNVKGQREYLALGNGTLTQYEYDSQTFRLIQLQTTRPADASGFPGRRSDLADPAIVQQLLYTYDPVGNITEIADQAYEPVFFQNQMVEPHSRYEYDALYRLISATGRENGALTGPPSNVEPPVPGVQFPVRAGDPNALRNYAQQFDYDSVGNILQITHVAAGGSWTRHMQPKSDSNRLDQSWDGNNTLQATNYQYDTHGNMLNFLNVTQDQFLRWDHRDMIGSINLGGGGLAYYQYDAGKQRTRKRLERLGGTVEERIYLGGYERYRRSTGGGVVEEIESHHLLEGAQRVLLVDDVISTDNSKLATGPLFRYQYSNHLGSACLELNDQAAVVSYEEYHPYGTSACRASTSRIEVPPKRYRYTGMERDEESGLSYHGARHYVSWLGRWTSTDPKESVDSTNLFFYGEDNPLTFIDPAGRDIVWSATWQGVKTGSVKVVSRVLDAFLYVGEVFSVPLGGAAGRFDDSMNFHLLGSSDIKIDRAKAAETNDKLTQTLARGPGYTSYAATQSVVLGIGRPIEKAGKLGYQAATSEGPNPNVSRQFGAAIPDAVVAASQLATLGSTAGGIGPTASSSLVTAEGFTFPAAGAVAANSEGLLGNAVLMAAAQGGDDSSGGTGKTGSTSSTPPEGSRGPKVNLLDPMRMIDRRLALGMRGNPKVGWLLEQFRTAVNAKTYWDIPKSVLFESKTLIQQLEQYLKAADSIDFNLTGLWGKGAAFRTLEEFLKESGTVTAWELKEILDPKKGLAGKTTFHVGDESFKTFKEASDAMARSQ